MNSPTTHSPTYPHTPLPHTHMYTSGSHSVSATCTTYYGHPRQPQVPVCLADGCINVVWYEPGLQKDLQVFDYCSPECRDRHLLPISRLMLAEDLIAMKQELHRVTTSEVSQKSNKPNRQLSKEHSSSLLALSATSTTGSIINTYH